MLAPAITTGAFAAAEVLVGSTLGVGVLGSTLLGSGLTGAVLLGAHMMPTWKAFFPDALAEVKAEQPELSHQEAMAEVSKRYHALKSEKEAPVAKTKQTGVPTRAKLEIPLVVDTRPDEAAGWDVAEGLVDGLFMRANSDNRATLIARANQAYARAKGEVSREDQTEWELGRDLVETLILVLARRGVTPDQWASLFPKELGTQGGIVSGTVESAGGLLGLGVDVNQDGAQASVGDAVGGVVEGVTQGVLNFME